VVVGEFTFASSKLLFTKEVGGGKYQPTRQQSNKATK
jgi:hypothetical protein